MLPRGLKLMRLEEEPFRTMDEFAEEVRRLFFFGKLTIGIPRIMLTDVKFSIAKNNNAKI
jgi:hypothetical protein